MVTSIPHPPPPPPSVVSSSAPLTFTHAITEKLTKDNFILWRQQIELVIKGYRLYSYLLNPRIPSCFLSEVDRDNGVVNPECLTWEQQDQFLLSWLQSTLTSSILTQVIGCVHAWELWEKLHEHFDAHMQAYATQLCTILRNTSLEGKDMVEFLARFEAPVVSLSSIGDLRTPCEHLDVLLQGLPRDYEFIVTLVSSKIVSLHIPEVGALLVANEDRLKHYNKQVMVDAASINLPEASNPNAP